MIRKKIQISKKWTKPLHNGHDFSWKIHQTFLVGTFGKSKVEFRIRKKIQISKKWPNPFTMGMILRAKFTIFPSVQIKANIYDSWKILKHCEK